MHQPRAEQVRADIIRVCHAGLDSRTLRVEIIKHLRRVMPIEVSFFTMADPATLLFTGAVIDDVLAGVTAQFIDNEFLHDDVNKFSSLARGAAPVGALIEATQQGMTHSARYRDILAPLSLGDELRAALVASGSCWGFMCLHRARSSTQFTPAEITFVRQLTPHIAEGLRTALLFGHATGLGALDEPGLLIVSDDLSVVAVTPAAERWLAEVAEDTTASKHALPSAVYAVVGRLLAIEHGGMTHPALLPKVRLRTASGHWLALHASRLASTRADAQIAVIFEVARPVEVAPLIVQAYQLSKRESEVLQSVLYGLSTAEMVATFQISSNTVQDHLKAIFDKVGVRSRRELVGSVFAQQYQPRILSGSALDTNGWFAAADPPSTK